MPRVKNLEQRDIAPVDHLLVDQLYTHLLSCLKVTHCSTSEIGDAPLYNMLSTDPSYDNTTISNTLKMQIRTVQCLKAQLNKVIFGVVSSDDHIIPPHIIDVGLKINTKVYLNVLKSVVQSGSRSQNLGVAAGLGASPKVQIDSGLGPEGVLRLCTVLSLPTHPSVLDLNPLDYFVENITNMTFYDTKTRLIAAIHLVFAEHSPSIRRAFAELQPAFVENACSQFRTSIKGVIVAEVG